MKRPPITIEEPTEQVIAARRGVQGPLTYWPGGTARKGWKKEIVNGKETLVYTEVAKPSSTRKSLPKALVYVLVFVGVLIFIFLLNKAKGV